MAGFTGHFTVCGGYENYWYLKTFSMPLAIYLTKPVLTTFSPNSFQPTKTPQEDLVTICNHQVDGPFYLLPDVCSSDLQHKKENGHT